jgi:hypothetical protein
MHSFQYHINNLSYSTYIRYVIHSLLLITDALITDDVPYNGRFFKVPIVRYKEQGLYDMYIYNKLMSMKSIIFKFFQGTPLPKNKQLELF